MMVIGDLCALPAVVQAFVVLIVGLSAFLAVGMVGLMTCGRR